MRVPLRGRALLRRITARDAVRAFRPGDFVLTSSRGGQALLLGVATGCDLNHAAVIVDPLGTTVEANPNLIADPRAFRTASVAEYLRAGMPVWIGYVELSEGTRKDVVAYVEHLARARGAASLAGRLLLALHSLLAVGPATLARRVRWLRPVAGLLDDHALVMREELCYSSGELVARALERGGFIWDRDPANVTPAMLFEHYHLRELTPVTPLPLHRLRPSPSRARRSPSGAVVTHFASRAHRASRATRGATALAESPRGQAQAQPGVAALLKVGVWAAAGLTAISLCEELVRTFARED
ncbi:MAG: hypothetical protein ACHQ4H_14985 [Ktedonobacterales bacterium]